MKIIQKGIYNGDLINTVLCNRNIGNLELFLNPDNSTETNPSQFRNAEQGKQLLLHHLRNDESKIKIVVDQDADGFTSSAIMFQFLKYLNGKAEIGYILHETKAHGLTEYIMGKIYEDKPTLVIIPDAGSNDVAQIEELVEKNIDVLVIDHHVVTSFTDKGVIINNQLCENTNNKLVGAGVVYKFLQLIDNEFGLEVIDTALDLVAVGQIGDASDISDNEIRYLVHRGLDNINNGFLKVAIGEKPIGSKLAPKDLSFGVIPIINAVTRVGTLEEREILFRALSHMDLDKVFPTVKKKKNKDTAKFDQVTFNFNIFEHAYDTAQKCKARQDTAVKKMVAKIDETLVDDAGVIVAFTGDTENPGITGLVANKIMGKYDKPVLLLNEQDTTWTGSGRGHTKTISDFRVWCEKSELVEFAQGHDNAFGICIHKDKLNAFKEYSRKIEKKQVVYEVDLITNKPDKAHCEVVDRNMRLFGGVVSEPFIGIVDLSVPKRFISQKGSMLTIFSYGVSMVQFGANQQFIDDIFYKHDEEYVKFNMVGYYGMSDWNGRKTAQFIIKDIEVVNNNNMEEIDEDNIIF